MLNFKTSGKGFGLDIATLNIVSWYIVLKVRLFRVWVCLFTILLNALLYLVWAKHSNASFACCFCIFFIIYFLPDTLPLDLSTSSKFRSFTSHTQKKQPFEILHSLTVILLFPFQGLLLGITFPVHSNSRFFTSAFWNQVDCKPLLNMDPLYSVIINIYVYIRALSFIYCVL